MTPLMELGQRDVTFHSYLHGFIPQTEFDRKLLIGMFGQSEENEKPQNAGKKKKARSAEQLAQPG